MTTTIYDTTNQSVIVEGQDMIIVDQGENTMEAMAAANRAETAQALAEDAADRAEAVAPSANTLALRDAVRTLGFYPSPTYCTPANDVATITVPAGGAVSAITGGAATSANVPVTTTTKITWLGGAADKDVNSTYFARGSWYAGGRSNNYSAYRFRHTGTQFEVQMLCNGIGAPGTMGNFRVLVQLATGEWVIAGFATLTGDGANRLIRVQFPVSATRTIMIEVCGGRHRGINVASTAEVLTSSVAAPLVTWIGDSFPEGSGADGGFEGEGIIPARALGLNCALAATGGTGVLQTGTGGKVNWQDANRLADLALNGFTDQITSTAANPLMGVIELSINDNNLTDTFWGGAASFEEAYYKGVRTMITHWKTHRPAAPLVIFGPTSTVEVPQLDAYRMRDQAQRAVMAFGGPAGNVWFIDRMTPSTSTRVGARNVSQQAGTLTSGSKVITGIGSTSGMQAGTAISGTGIPAPSRIISVDSATQVTIDRNATVSGSQTLTFRIDQTAYYTGTDDVHPGLPGHPYDGLWKQNELRRLIMNEFY